MDEPLSNLDAKLGVQTRTQIAALQRKLGVTTVYVTHDQTEALTMGDCIAVLKEGKLQQVGTPRELYDSPRNTFVASFIGSPAMNLSTFSVDAQGYATNGSARVELPEQARSAISSSGESTVVVGFRPEGLEYVPSADSASLADSHGVVSFVVDFTEELGSDTYLYGHLDGTEASSAPSVSAISTNAGTAGAAGTAPAAPVATQNAADIVMRVAASANIQAGETVHAAVVPGGLHVFSAGDGERLN